MVFNLRMRDSSSVKHMLLYVGPVQISIYNICVVVVLYTGLLLHVTLICFVLGISLQDKHLRAKRLMFFAE